MAENPTYKELVQNVIELEKKLRELKQTEEAGKLDFKPSDVSLKPLLENSLTMIKKKAVKHSIQRKYLSFYNSGL